MSEQSKLSHVFIAADDALAVRKAFELLGLELLMDEGGGHYVRFGGGGGFHAGLEPTEFTETGPGIELNVRVPDVDEAHKVLVDGGVAVPEPITQPWGAKHAQFEVGGVRLAIYSD